MKKMLIDVDGFPTAFYDDEIHSIIPDGCINITDEQWMEFITHQNQRKWDGTNVVVAFPSVDVVSLKASSRLAVDGAAGHSRLKSITPNMDDIYREKYEQAVEFAAAGYPADASPYPFVVAEANATSTSNQVAADSIIAARQQWMIKMAAIEEQRRLGKVNIDAATDVAGVEAARDTAIAALQAL